MKNMYPKLLDVGENNVGEIVCWRKKNFSFKIICMLVNNVGENSYVCWRKVFLLTTYIVCIYSIYCMLVKYVSEKCMLVKLFHSNMYVGESLELGCN